MMKAWMIGAAAAVVASAPALAETQGLHVYVFSQRVGQAFVDKSVSGPFRGTSAQAERRKQDLEAEAARRGETVRAYTSVYRPGQCISVYQQDDETTYRAYRNPAVDTDRFFRMMQNRKQGFRMILEKQCL